MHATFAAMQTFIAPDFIGHINRSQELLAASRGIRRGWHESTGALRPIIVHPTEGVVVDDVPAGTPRHEIMDLWWPRLNGSLRAAIERMGDIGSAMVISAQNPPPASHQRTADFLAAAGWSAPAWAFCAMGELFEGRDVYDHAVFPRNAMDAARGIWRRVNGPFIGDFWHHRMTSTMPGERPDVRLPDPEGDITAASFSGYCYARVAIALASGALVRSWVAKRPTTNR